MIAWTSSCSEAFRCISNNSIEIPSASVSKFQNAGNPLSDCVKVVVGIHSSHKKPTDFCTFSNGFGGFNHRSQPVEGLEAISLVKDFLVISRLKFSGICGIKLLASTFYFHKDCAETKGEILWLPSIL